MKIVPFGRVARVGKQGSVRRGRKAEWKRRGTVMGEILEVDKSTKWEMNRRKGKRNDDRTDKLKEWQSNMKDERKICLSSGFCVV